MVQMYAKSERLRLIMKGQGFHLARNLIILGHWQSSTRCKTQTMEIVSFVCVVLIEQILEFS